MKKKKVKKSKKKLLSKDQEIELGKKIAEGNELARNKFIKRNIGLVVSIANNYAEYGSDLKDLISFGYLGLLKGVKDWDYNRGTRFSTYAYPKIKAKIKEGLRKDRLVVIPPKVYEEYKKIKDFEDQYFAIYGQQPNNKELAEFCKEFSEKEIEAIKARIPIVTSLNTTIDDEGEVEMLDTIQGDDINAIEKVNEISERDLSNKALNQLTETERNVLMLRNGIGVDKEMTLKEVSEELNISIERVRQTEIQAKMNLDNFIKSTKNLK